MPLDFYIEKANPLWDGDGVQGVGQSRDRRGRWSKIGAATALAGIAVATGMSGSAAAATTTDRTKAPTTAAGYQKMWNEQVSPDEWGGADVSLSVKLSDGRVVWLYGDTFSRNNGFVHSTAIVQNGGTLKVSNGGRQLLPNDKKFAGRKSIYWITDAKASGGNKVKVTAQPMSVGDGGFSDFKPRSNLNRVGLLKVLKNGNVKFIKWLKWVKPALGFKDLKKKGNKVTYERRAHKEAKLASGKTLMTANRNYTNGLRMKNGELDWFAYRAMFYEGDGKELRYTEAEMQYFMDLNLESAETNMVLDPSLPQTIEDISKANPLWDGDGVQGAGQPRDRRGRWVGLPGPTSIKRIGAFDLDDGSIGIFTDENRRPIKTYKSPSAANKFVSDAIKTDAEEYRKERRRVSDANRRLRQKVEREKADREKASAEAAKEEAKQRKAEDRKREKLFGPAPKQKRQPKPKVSVKAEPAPTRRGRVQVGEAERLPFPGRPTADQVQALNKWAKKNMKDEEAKYAGLIARLLLRRQVTQDPKIRGDMSRRYGITPKRLVEIEQDVHEFLFPPNKGPDRKTQVARLRGIAPDISKPQIDNMLALGARSSTPEANPPKGKNPTRVFKINKGPQRGKWASVTWDGEVKTLTDKQAQKAVADSRVAWTKRLLERWKTDKERRAKLDAAREQQREANDADRKLEREIKIAAAQKWAIKNNLDPDDSYWWALYWNDASLLKSQDDKTSTPIKVGLSEIMVREKMDPAILEGLLALPDIDARDMRGHRPGSRKAVKGDEDFEEAKPESRQDAPEWEDRNLSAQLKHQRRLRAAYERYKAKHPKSKITIGEFTEYYYNNKMRIPGGTGGKIKKAKNPLWDGDGVQVPGQPRGKGGRWTDGVGGSALGAAARAMDLGDAGSRRHHGSTPRRVARVTGTPVLGSKKSAFKNGQLQVKLNRLPRGGKHVMEDAKGKPLQSKPMTPEEAIVRRNVGSSAISNARLKAIWEAYIKSGKMPSQREYDLIVSAGGQRHIDGDTENIRTKLKSGASVSKSRSDLFTMLRSQWAVGSGDRSHKRAGISTESREKAKAKRRESLKWNSATQAQKRDQLAEIFSDDGHSSICIFCGDRVMNTRMSLETIKPKSAGGTYTIGDMVPAHRQCNERGNKLAQANPKLYYKKQRALYIERYSLKIRRRHIAAGRIAA